YDVVIANAYPMDVSLTFARSKGLAPLAHSGSQASRVLIAACPEGLGLHRIFPYLNGPRFEAQIHRLRRWSIVRPSTIPKRAVRKARAAGGGFQPRPPARARREGVDAPPPRAAPTATPTPAVRGPDRGVRPRLRSPVGAFGAAGFAA